MKLHKLSNVISPAINLWLHSQLDQVQTLDINITGRNRDLLQGYIPQVSLFGSYPVYQGLHLGQVELTGSNIRVNLAQILKGQPLRLLEPVLVKGKVVLEQSHLNLSLASSLLSTALTELVSKFLQTTSDYSQDYWHNLPVNWENIEIKADKLILKGTALNKQGIITPVILRSGLMLANHRKLKLQPLEIEAFDHKAILDDFEIDLGSQVQLEELNLTDGKINCHGSITVISPEMN